MDKKHKNKEKEPMTVAEPAIAYGINSGSNAPFTHISLRNRILENTISVDEYFDKLISLVHQDYENLHSED